ncbi:MAG: DUF2855 family protein [Pseudohongiella sp.]|nr:DUF2855 family protein [Pseudohongiella sp.]
MPQQPHHRLLINKHDLTQVRIEDQSPPAPPSPGELILAPDLFSLTTNNITYAAYGTAMRYWDFFPTGDADWGQVPVWGFANVVASAVEGISVGERFYGYFPPASELRVQAANVGKRGFRDGTAHRQALPAAYNQYLRCDVDPLYSADSEAFQAIYRPLFITSFTLADFLADNNWFGAERVVISSASSKTAYGTGFCIGDAVETIGLTSERNRDFVAGSGCYRHTLTYSELDTLDAQVPTLYVDFSGDRELRSAIHHQCRELKYSCVVGSAQTVVLPKKQTLPGPAPMFFFAPDQIIKRTAEWGAQTFGEQLGDAWSRFGAHVNDPQRELLTIVEGHGLDAAQQVFAQLLAGGVTPQEGHVIRL